ncbi:lysylphosphatidylglycerol synthase transmembrane domain-containing protein [Halomarina ordinaria]|uniref:YbhN family protein n=1 Tax=Halomarina ordinaria TaxID=3033939 RepID=A0ABD5UC29_9EURY|nr:lysylphosphatidylglycerol synthase transmembrane domain-containing protein [Halomarina sp. PSRA2]
MRRETLITTGGGVLAALAVFAVMLWLTDARAVVDAVVDGDPWLLAAVAATVLLWNVAWGFALWNVLCTQAVDASLGQALLVHAAAGFANHVTPLGQAGGEPVTAWLLSRTVDTDYEVGLASVASLDAINVVPSLSFVTVGVSYYALTGTPAVRDRLGLAPAVVLVLAVALPTLAVLGWRRRRGVERLFGAAVEGAWRRLAAVVPFVSLPERGAVGARVAGFRAAVERVAADRRRLAAAVCLSALGWAFQAVGLWATFLALGASIPVVLPFFVVPLGTLGGAVPTPGGLGGTEAVNVGLLTLLTGAPASTVVAAVLVHSVGGYLLTTSVGAAATAALGVRVVR